MSQKTILKIKGLATNQNQLSEVVDGSLTVAKNINIDKDSIGEGRRGFGYINSTLPSGFHSDRLTTYKDVLIARSTSSNTLSRYDGTSWTDYAGSYSHPDSDYARMRFVQSSGNLYFTTNNGVMVLDQTSGPIYSTGMPPGLDGVAVTSGSSGFMSKDTQIAYRIVWGSRDNNNNLYLGTPSQRIIATNNTAGNRDISLTFTIPDGITVNDFYQIYRSKESASHTDEPNDELQLVYEKNPSSGEISSKSVTVLDQTPTSLMGASLYTNASQEGISETNDRPPLAKDLAEFKGFMFYANIMTRHNLTISLLSVGGVGLVVDDQIVINSITYTAKSTENISSAQFLITTSGSAAQNIEDTAKSLVKVINQYSGNTGIYAYYMSSYQDLPGVIRLESRVLNSSGFSVTTTRAQAFDLNDGTSDDEVYINGLSWSKIQQPEHVPISHLEFVGSKNYATRRIIALRDALFIIKDDGVFRLTGSNGSWSIDPLDTSTKIIAPDSAVVVNNQIYCLSDQGIVAISDVGVEVKSRPIEDRIQELISRNYTNLKTLSFGVNYETDRKYILWTIKEYNDSFCTQAFVYNTFTNAWTTWERNVTHGVVNTNDDHLYLSHALSPHVYKERKDYTFTDFVDEEFDGYNMISHLGKNVVLDSSSNIEIGDVIYQSSTAYSIIEDIFPATNTFLLNSVINWTNGPCTILKAIDCELEFTNQPLDNAGLMKHFQEVAWLFRDKNFNNASSSFYTDLSGGYSNTEIRGTFGSDLWLSLIHI